MPLRVGRDELSEVAAAVRQSPETQNITGQIFIVLENRETVKLSLTDVYLIDLDIANRIILELVDRRKQALQQTLFFLLTKTQLILMHLRISPERVTVRKNLSDLQLLCRLLRTATESKTTFRARTPTQLPKFTVRHYFFRPRKTAILTCSLASIDAE
jgi:hypothetical protein